MLLHCMHAVHTDSNLLNYISLLSPVITAHSLWAIFQLNGGSLKSRDHTQHRSAVKW